jgi:hypothetical protein
VPLEELPRLLLAADIHLVTLRDPFVGYVLPSKIHACIASGKRILFVGSRDSDVHLLASGALPSGRYRRIDVGNVEGLANALRDMELAVAQDGRPDIMRTDWCANVDRVPEFDFAIRNEKSGSDVMDSNKQPALAVARIPRSGI